MADRNTRQQRQQSNVPALGDILALFSMFQPTPGQQLQAQGAQQGNTVDSERVAVQQRQLDQMQQQFIASQQQQAQQFETSAALRGQDDTAKNSLAAQQQQMLADYQKQLIEIQRKGVQLDEQKIQGEREKTGMQATANAQALAEASLRDQTEKDKIKAGIVDSFIRQGNLEMAGLYDKFGVQAYDVMAQKAKEAELAKQAHTMTTIKTAIGAGKISEARRLSEQAGWTKQQLEAVLNPPPVAGASPVPTITNPTVSAPRQPGWEGSALQGMFRNIGDVWQALSFK